MKTQTRLSTHIRWMIRPDVPEVLEIERDCFGERAWTEDDFIRCLRRRDCIGMVAEYEDRVIGSMIYELHKNQLDILNFAVSPWWTRRGVGTQMMQKLINKLSAQRRKRIVCHAWERSDDFLLFLKAVGFRCTGVEREHFDNGDDAYVMEYRYGEIVDA